MMQMGLNLAGVHPNSLLSVAAPAASKTIPAEGTFAASLRASAKANGSDVTSPVPLASQDSSGQAKQRMASGLDSQMKSAATEQGTAAPAAIAAGMAPEGSKVASDAAASVDGEQAQTLRVDHPQVPANVEEIKASSSEEAAVAAKPVALAAGDRNSVDGGPAEQAVTTLSSMETASAGIASKPAVPVPAPLVAVPRIDTKAVAHTGVQKNSPKSIAVDQSGVAEAANVVAVSAADAPATTSTTSTTIAAPLVVEQVRVRDAAVEVASPSGAALAAPVEQANADPVHVQGATSTVSKPEASTAKHVSGAKAQSVSTSASTSASTGLVQASSVVTDASGLSRATVAMPGAPVAVVRNTAMVASGEPGQAPMGKSAVIGGVNAVRGRSVQDAAATPKADATDASPATAVAGVLRAPVEGSSALAIATEPSGTGAVTSVQGVVAVSAMALPNHAANMVAALGADSRHTASDPLAGQSSGSGEYQTLVATPNVLEVGLTSGSHGWLRVRAELEPASGEVAASVITSSSASAQTLHQQVPAIAAYLASEQIGVSSVSVNHAETMSSGGSANLSFDGNGSRQQNASGQQQATPSSNWPELGNDWTGGREGLSTASLSTELYAPTGGSWLSVRA